MDAVGLAGAIGGAVVGLAGVGASAWAVWTQRESARELAERQQAHELDMAQRARLAERRAPVYEEVLRVLYQWMDRIDLTEPILISGKPGKTPDAPTLDEWNKMLARLRVNGSRGVGDAYEEFEEAGKTFFAHVAGVRFARENPAAGPMPVQEMQNARMTARRKLTELERLMGDEMAAF